MSKTVLIRYISKFKNSYSMECAHCGRWLAASPEPVENPRHLYSTGIMYSCSCGRGKIWTNSIRNEDRFKKWLNGEQESYTNGFCNDSYCGHCFGFSYPLMNGYQPYCDLIGCINPKCPSQENKSRAVFEKIKKAFQNRTTPEDDWLPKDLDFYTNFVISDGRQEDKVDSTPETLVEYYTKFYGKEIQPKV